MLSMIKAAFGRINGPVFGYVAGFLALLCLGMWLLLRIASAQIDALNARIDGSKTEIVGLNAEINGLVATVAAQEADKARIWQQLAALDTAASQYNAALEGIENRQRNLSQQLNEYRSSPNAELKDWMAAPVPADVERLLRHAGHCAHRDHRDSAPCSSAGPALREL